MLVRCKSCSKANEFRNGRGAKMSNYSCTDCGGTLEMVGGSHALSGTHPFNPAKTHTSEWYVGTYYYADKNRSGKYFVYNKGFYHEIENPVLPEKRVKTEKA